MFHEKTLVNLEDINKYGSRALLAAQAKTGVLEQGAQTAAQAASGGGGDTNVTVVAPTTANSTVTNQNINPNPLMSQNPRTAMGVGY